MGTDGDSPWKRKHRRKGLAVLRDAIRALCPAVWQQRRPAIPWDAIRALCSLALLGIEITKMLAGN